MAIPPFVSSIQGINNQYSYRDENPGGKKDSTRVSCGQDGSYNELQYIYDTYLAPKIASSSFTHQQALDALNSACFNMSSPRDRKDFYKHLETYLGKTIFPADLK